MRIFFTVIEPGEVNKGSHVEIVTGDPHGVTVADIERLYLGPTLEPELVHQALDLDGLRQNWRAGLLLRAKMDYQ
jgi:MOSC domain-containing protein YiiM